jgi:hypothetical protein
MSFTIPSSLKTVYNEFADSLLSSDMTAFICKAHYPPVKEACINCEAGPFGDGSTYRAGGPNPFTFGVCPICQGAGFKEVETSENLRLRVYLTPKKFKDPENIETASGYVIGFLTDMDKIKRAAFLEIISEHTNYHMLRFRLAGQPIPHGFGRTRYFRCDIENN